MSGSLTLGTFLFFLTAFLSISSGIIASSDGLTIFTVAQAIVERGEIAVSGERLSHAQRMMGAGSNEAFESSSFPLAPEPIVPLTAGQENPN